MSRSQERGPARALDFPPLVLEIPPGVWNFRRNSAPGEDPAPGGEKSHPRALQGDLLLQRVVCLVFLSLRHHSGQLRVRSR